MDAGSRRTLRWVLGAGGAVGLLCAGSMLLVTLAEYAAKPTAANVAARLPYWAQLGAAPPASLSMLIAGFLCALLLVVGGWPVRVCAALVAVWFVYAQATFGNGSPLQQKVSETFDYTSFYHGGLVGVTALLVVSLLALVIAIRPTTPYLTPGRAPRAP